MQETHPQVQRVIDAAAAHDLSIEVKEYAAGAKTAVDAAASVGCDVAQIVKSLIFDLDGELILALTSGKNRVDTDRLAELAGGGRCGRADVDDVRETTGFAIGGVPPIGHSSPCRVFLDTDLLTFDTVWAAAGTPRHVFAIDPDVLSSISEATVGSFGREG